jgi:hypothetical protein
MRVLFKPVAPHPCHALSEVEGKTVARLENKQ